MRDVLKDILRIIIGFCLILVIMLPVLAQLGTSALNGKVIDATGAIIVGATITIINTTTNQTRQTTSDERGLFIINSLAPASYKITIVAEGFTTVTTDNVLVRIGEPVSIVAKIKPSSIKEVIEINANDARGVNTTKSDVFAIISETAILTLPLNGRNFIDLAFLLPGNTPGPNFDPTKNNTIEVSSVGQVGRSGNLAVDGGDNNDDCIGGTLQNFPQDSVREFQIITNRFSADIGRSSSSAINIITKNGTNELHGSTGFYFRNNKLSALPSTLDRSIISTLGDPPFDRQQYTATLGGPIIRDKFWYFTAFEYRKQDAISLTGVRDVAARIIRNNFAQAPLHDLLFTARADLQLTPKDKMFFRNGFENEDQVERVLGISSTPLDTANHRQKSFNNYNSFVYNYVRTLSDKAINDFVFQQSYFRSRIPAFVKGPEIIFPSIADGGNFQLPQSIGQKRYQFRDNLSLILGAHSLKFGAELHHLDADESLALFQSSSFFLSEDFASQDRNGDGVINDSDLALDFVIQGVNTNPFTEYKNNYIGFYIQDDWKVLPNVTFNLGLRYELDTESNNKSVLKQILPFLKPFIGRDSRPIDKGMLGPRIGFNWDVFSDSKTSIHGGYGIYYNRIVFNVLDLERRGSIAPRNLLTIGRAGSSLDDDGNFFPGSPTLDNPFVGDIDPNSVAGFFVLNSNIRHPMVQQFNFGFQQRLAQDLVLSVDAIHTFGTRFLANRFAGVVFDPDPSVNGDAAVSAFEPSSKNWYDGLLVNLEKKPSKNFSFIASYTLSKGLNYVNDDTYPLGFSPIIDTENIKLEKGPTVDDQRHRFTFAGNYQAPYGISLSAIYVATSSIPVDILLPDGSSRIPLIQRNAGARQFHNGRELNTFIQQINSGGGIEGVGLLPLVRDDVNLGRTFQSLDMRLVKSVVIKEKTKIEAMIEVFNIFNRTNIRGFNNLSFSGIQNILARDSQDPGDPGFLRSSAFGSKIQTAGGVFGTGGPRAIQFSIHLSF